MKDTKTYVRKDENVEGDQNQFKAKFSSKLFAKLYEYSKRYQSSQYLLVAHWQVKKQP